MDMDRLTADLMKGHLASEQTQDKHLIHKDTKLDFIIRQIEM